MFDLKPASHYIIHTKKNQRMPTNKAFNSLSFRGKRGYTAKAKSPSPPHTIRQPRTFGGILIHTKPSGETVYALVQGRATGKWSFPKGHSNPDEATLACAKREIAEETSIEQLPKYTNYIKMGYGHYYIFNLSEQLPLVARDTKEVMDTMWATLEEMKQLPLNADASLFVKKKAALNNKDIEDAECQNR